MGVRRSGFLSWELARAHAIVFSGEFPGQNFSKQDAALA